MITYMFDGTFEGLITSFYYAFKNKKEANFLCSTNSQLSLLNIDFEVTTDFSIYIKMEKYLCEKCTYECFDALYKAYLCKTTIMYSHLFYFVKKAIKYKEQTLFLRTDDIINKILKAQLNVERETHKMLGFLRFKKINNNILFAKYSPTNNVTTLLTNHFISRFNQYHFIILDENRRIYAYYNKKKCIIGKFDNNANINSKDIEANYEEFFKTYCTHISIKERKNPRLQSNFIPKKYWNFMIEMQNIQ